MKNVPNSYCCRCKRAVYLDHTPDVHGGSPCPYCGVSLADTGMPWDFLRSGWKGKDGKPLPQVGEEGKIYELKNFLEFGDVEVVKIPNKTTRRAIAELEAGKGQEFNSVAEMMAALDTSG